MYCVLYSEGPLSEVLLQNLANMHSLHAILAQQIFTQDICISFYVLATKHGLLYYSDLHWSVLQNIEKFMKPQGTKGD